MRQDTANSFQTSGQAIRIGVVGGGRISQRVHLPVLKTLPDFQVVAVADPDEGRRDAAADLVLCERAYPTLDAMLEDGGCDAVLISTPPATHAPLAITAFEHGLHVYLEKPVAASSEDARAIETAWRQSGKAGVVGFNYRFHPQVQRLRSIVADGELGRIVAVQTAFTSPPRLQEVWKQRRDTGGGVLLDLGSHHFDLLPFLLGESFAEVDGTISSRSIEGDTVSVRYRMSGGAFGQSLFLIGAAAVDRIEVVGDRGRAVLDRLSGELVTSGVTPPTDMLERASAEIAAFGTRFQRSLRPSSEPSYPEAFRAFAAEIRGRATDAASVEQAVHSLEVLDAVERSAEKREPVTLETIASEGVPAGHPDKTVKEPAEVVAHTDGDGPTMSVILVTAERFESIRTTLRHLRDQTIQSELEVILIGPDDAAFAAMHPDDVAGFENVEIMKVGTIENVDVAAAVGIRAARSTVVAMVEDHAFPDPNWCEAMAQAHDGPYAIVGSAFANANPESILSWANMFMAYGMWIEPTRRGEAKEVSRHNVTFKKSVIMQYDAELEHMLGRDGGLLQRMAGDGHRSMLETSARITHVNPSKLWSTVLLRYNAGRLRAATRAKRNAWPAWRRALYVVCGPALPVLLYRGMCRDFFGEGRRAELRALGVRAMLIGTALDGVGQVVGFAFGAGRSASTLASFEFERPRHMRPSERHILTG